jgi:hypothetical protein
MILTAVNSLVASERCSGGDMEPLPGCVTDGTVWLGSGIELVGREPRDSDVRAQVPRESDRSHGRRWIAAAAAYGRLRLMPGVAVPGVGRKVDRGQLARRDRNACGRQQGVPSLAPWRERLCGSTRLGYDVGDGVRSRSEVLRRKTIVCQFLRTWSAPALTAARDRR